MRDDLDAEDRIKLETWPRLMTLLEYYRMLTFDPMYQQGLKFLASAEDKKTRAEKVEIIRKVHVEIEARWERALGPKWREIFYPDWPI